MNIFQYLLVFSFWTLNSFIISLSAKYYEYVGCGSVIKLLNSNHNVRLHSHDVKYGSGSGQQSVTGTETQEDINSYWAVKGKSDK